MITVKQSLMGYWYGYGIKEEVVFMTCDESTAHDLAKYYNLKDAIARVLAHIEARQHECDWEYIANELDGKFL